MAYDRVKIYEQAKHEITTKKLIWIDEVISLLPISRPTFYEFFPLESNKLNTLKELIEANKISLKISMRKKWYTSDNPTLQVALMKIIATDEEVHRLNGSRQEIKHEGEFKVIWQEEKSYEAKP